MDVKSNLNDIDIENLPEYFFEFPEANVDPRLLALLPQKSFFEQVIDIGLYFVAAFQVSEIVNLKY